MAGIYLDATQADYNRMILRCGLTVVPCQFRGTLRPCVRIECIAAVQRAYGFSRNLDGTLPLVSKRPEKYRQVNGRRVCAWMAVCKAVGFDPRSGPTLQASGHSRAGAKRRSGGGDRPPCVIHRAGRSVQWQLRPPSRGRYRPLWLQRASARPPLQLGEPRVPGCRAATTVADARGVPRCDGRAGVPGTGPWVLYRLPVPKQDH